MGGLVSGASAEAVDRHAIAAAGGLRLSIGAAARASMAMAMAWPVAGAPVPVRAWTRRHARMCSSDHLGANDGDGDGEGDRSDGRRVGAKARGGLLDDLQNGDAANVGRVMRAPRQTESGEVGAGTSLGMEALDPTAPPKDVLGSERCQA